MAGTPVANVPTVASYIGLQNITRPPSVEIGSPAPGMNDPATKVAMQTAAEEQRRKRGMAANILTSGQGILESPLTAKQVLLGS